MAAGFAASAVVMDYFGAEYQLDRHSAHQRGFGTLIGHARRPKLTPSTRFTAT
jgi:hypothetical protein